MTRPRHRVRSAARALTVAARLAATVEVVRRLSSAARGAPPLAPPDVSPSEHDAEARPLTITVVVPARDEARRIGPLLERVVGAPGVAEVIVVDDESTDDTAATAEAAGARVVTGTERPTGWAGKTWALQQGVDSATTDWIVTLDADTRPDPELPIALIDRIAADRLDLITVGGRFDCADPLARALQAAMLTTLVYRFGAPGADVPADRLLANGQCTAFRRGLLTDDGFSVVAGEVVEDVALARRLAETGRRVAFLDGSDLLRVRMFESLTDTWTGWRRSLALPGVEPLTRQLVGLALVALVQATPLTRLLLGRADAIDLVGVALRLGTLVGTRSAFDRADSGYWASPLADVPATIALADGIRRRGRQTWRGRFYA